MLILSIVLSITIVSVAYLNGYDNITGKPDGLAKIILVVLLINVAGSIIQIVAEALKILEDWRKIVEEEGSKEPHLTEEDVEFLLSIIKSQRHLRACRGD